ncbi:hypothetical protein M272_04290 [Vibrio natriegens NBRC 15636 = ATCC 14048 = DSM 759]|nr:hypothetical protein M272_04290 [Vibrio natriegens NBRC 15636 = ATCC 14048 = DSM 759]
MLRLTEEKKATTSMANVLQATELDIYLATYLWCELSHQQKCPDEFAGAFLNNIARTM